MYEPTIAEALACFDEAERFLSNPVAYAPTEEGKRRTETELRQDFPCLITLHTRTRPGGPLVWPQIRHTCLDVFRKLATAYVNESGQEIV